MTIDLPTILGKKIHFAIQWQFTAAKSFRLASYCSLQGFDKKHPHTLQLVIHRQNDNPSKSQSSRSFFGSKSRSYPMLFQRDTNHVLVSLKDKGMMVALEKI